MGLFGDSDSEDNVDSFTQSLVEDARHESVTAERLTKLKPGRMSRYLTEKPLVEHLEQGEQPHFILAERAEAPSVDGANAPPMPERSGTGMVMHLITDRRWLVVASNSDGDQTLTTRLDEIREVEYDLGGHGTHEITVGVGDYAITIPIANLYDDSDIEAVGDYLYEVTEATEDGRISETEPTDADEADGSTDEEDGEEEDKADTEEKGNPDATEDDEERSTEGSETRSAETEESGRSEAATGNVAPEDVEAIEQHLDSDESVHHVLKGSSVTIEGGNSEDRKGSLTGTVRTAVTDRRVLSVIPQKLMGEDTKSVPYDDMGGVDFNKGLVNKYLKIQSHGRTYKIHTSDAKATKEAKDFIRKRKKDAKQESQSTNDSGTDPTEQLKNIKELHEQGVLTDDEFEEKKSELLDKI